MNRDTLIKPEIKKKLKKEHDGKNQRKLAEKYNLKIGSVCHCLAEQKVKGKESVK